MNRTAWTKRLIAAGVAAGVIAWMSPLGRGLRSRLAATKRYEGAVAAYMLEDVDRARALFGEVARDYPDLPIGALAELKIAFLAYDEERDPAGAERLFREFLEKHPETILHLPESPKAFEYYGELQLVAYFFLGRIAQDRGDPREARRWYDRVVETGSVNPANYIIGETKTIIRRLDGAGGMGEGHE